jgi:Acetyltransferase (GNAT) domain
MLEEPRTTFALLHHLPEQRLRGEWLACISDSDFPTHYSAPEFFCEPMLRNRQPFAVLSVIDGKVTGALTGVHDGSHVQSGLSVRPQIALSRRADRARAMAALIDGLLTEAKNAELVDLFLWSDTGLIDPRFRRRRYEGVVMLDLCKGPEALFRKLSENKRRNIKRAIKSGVSVAPAQNREDIAAYYNICLDWSRRKQLPAPAEDEFHQMMALKNNRLLLLARHKGKVIAGVVIRFFPQGVMEYAANSSLQNALHLRPNDLLHWRAIEWGCGEGMRHYSLGGAHLFLRKFGGEIVPTTRHRVDLSIFRRFAIGDWIADRAEQARPLISGRLATVARSLRGLVEEPRNPRAKTGDDRPPLPTRRIWTGK